MCEPSGMKKMNREDVYAFFETLEPTERALKELYLSGREYSEIGDEDEELLVQAERWEKEYHPDPLLARMARVEGRMLKNREKALGNARKLGNSQEGQISKWEDLDDCGRSIQIMKHFRYLPGSFHKHEYIEISYVHSGSCRHVFQAGQERHEIELLPGDLVIIPPGMEHKVEVFNDGVMLNIMVEVSTFRELFLQNLTGSPALIEFFGAIIWEGGHLGVMLLHTKGDVDIADVLADLVIHYVQKHPYSGQICEHFLGVWLLLILPYCTDMMELFGEASEERKLAVSIIGFLQKHYMTASLQSVADTFHYSATHVNRVLKKYMGTTVLKEIQHLKIQRACTLLEETRLSVEEISGCVGYENTSYFIEQFRREMQTTPLQYRKNIKVYPPGPSVPNAFRASGREEITDV